MDGRRPFRPSLVTPIPNGSMVRVTLENIAKFDAGSRQPIVDRMSVQIDDREIWAVVGPENDGPSALLRMIAGWEEPTSGEIRIDGRLVHTIAPAERGVATVSGASTLYPHLTVYQNIAFGLRMRRMARARIDPRVREAAGMLGLTVCLNRRPASLALDQRLRVSLARAIARRPSVYLLDNPFAALELRTRIEMCKLLRDIHPRLAAAMIYATPGRDEAENLGGPIAVITQGRLETQHLQF